MHFVAESCSLTFRSPRNANFSRFTRLSFSWSFLFCFLFLTKYHCEHHPRNLFDFSAPFPLTNYFLIGLTNRNQFCVRTVQGKRENHRKAYHSSTIRLSQRISMFASHLSRRSWKSARTGVILDSNIWKNLRALKFFLTFGIRVTVFVSAFLDIDVMYWEPWFVWEQPTSGASYRPLLDPYGGYSV